MPRVSREQTDKNRIAIEEVSARLFREQGLGGVSVPDLMAAAGLTHGGFYGHFSSKDELAAIACTKAFEQSSARWVRWIQEGKDKQATLAFLAKAYLTTKQRDEPGDGCAAVALASDVARQSDDRPVRAAYLAGVKGMLESLISLSGAESRKEQREEALVQLATMVGAVTLARATKGDAISEDVLVAVRNFLSHSSTPAVESPS